MKRLLFVLVLAAAVAVATAVIAAGQGAAPPTSGPVRVAEPVDAPPRAGRPAVARTELRLDDPDGGPRMATIAWGRCHATGVERNMARYPVRDHHRCRRPTAPLSFGVAQGVRTPTVVTGVAPEAVERITLSGPGGTHELPLSRSRLYAAAYSAKETGTATLTAHLADGTTRYREISLAGGHALEGAVTAEDPEGGPAWQANAELRTVGARRGQTCPQFSQRETHEFSPPLCGDLSRDPVVANTMQMRPGPARSTFGPSPRAPERTIVWGAAGEQVREVAIRDPKGERTLALSARGRAFLAVYPASVAPADLRLIIRHVDGRTTESAAPDRLGAAPLNPQRISFVRPLRARLDGTRLVLTATLSRAARRYTLSVLGRPVHMRRHPGTAGRYRGVYDASHGKYRRRAKVGATIGVSYTLCAPHCTAFTFLDLRIGPPPARASTGRAYARQRARLTVLRTRIPEDRDPQVRRVERELDHTWRGTGRWLGEASPGYAYVLVAVRRYLKGLDPLTQKPDYGRDGLCLRRRGSQAGMVVCGSLRDLLGGRLHGAMAGRTFGLVPDGVAAVRPRPSADPVPVTRNFYVYDAKGTSQIRSPEWLDAAGKPVAKGPSGGAP